MPKYAMVIDLQRCVGCGACSIACRNENNVPEGIYWSSKITETSGTFPNVRYHYRPTLCNHCSNAPCVTGCPTKAMHKLDNGITMHDPGKCIGCRYCEAACPYWARRFNFTDPKLADEPEKETELLNPDMSYLSNRPRQKGVMEKCHFCLHRTREGKMPACLEVCPVGARKFGNLLDPESEVSLALKHKRVFVLKEEVGTLPRFFYYLDEDSYWDRGAK